MFEWSRELWWTHRHISLSRTANIYQQLNMQPCLHLQIKMVLTLLSRVQSQLEMALLANSYCSHKATDCSIVWLCGDVYPSVICVSANSRPAVFGIDFKLPKKGFQTDQ